MIYDTFIFCDEVELLKMRLTELWDVVDLFVFVEARENHRGRPKKLHFTDNFGEFEPWKTKIACLVMDSYPGCDGDNKAANMQREHIGRERLSSFPYESGSTIIFGDADEICKPEVIRAYQPNQGPAAVEMMFTHYFFNCVHPDTTKRTLIAPVDVYRKNGFDNARWHVTDHCPVIHDGGWHHSYLGGYQALRDKIDGAVEGCSSDWVLNEDPGLIQSRIDAGQLYNGEKQFSFIPVDERMSKYVRDNKDGLTAKGLVKAV